MAADPIDERYDEIVRGLRALPGAPAELRGRVLELAATAYTPRPLRRGLTLAGAIGLLAVALVAGIVLTSGGSRSKSTSQGANLAARPAPARAKRSVELAPVLGKTHSTAQDSIGLPISPGRLTEVHASLRLRVSSVSRLSKATARAMKITRNLGGFVPSVDYGPPSGGEGGAGPSPRDPGPRGA